MAATLVQSTGLLGVSSSTAASETYNASTAFTVGNRVILAITVNGNGLISSVSIAGTTANQDAARTTDTFRNCWIFSAKIVNSGNTSVVINYDNTNSRSVALSIEEWSGIEYTPLDRSNNAILTSTTTHSIQTTTATTFANELVYAVMMTLSNPGTVTFPAGYTTTFDNYDANPYNVYGGAAYKTETTTGIKTASWTSTNAVTNRLAIATYIIKNDEVTDNGFVQHNWNDDPTDSSIFDDITTVTMPSNVTNSNVLLWCIFLVSSNTYTLSGGGLTYTEVGNTYYSSLGWYFVWGYAKVTSTQALTVTCTGSVASSPALYVMERNDVDYNNPATTGQLNGRFPHEANAAVVFSSGRFTTPGQADQLILSMHFCTKLTAVPVPGTGYRDHGLIWNEDLGGGANSLSRVISKTYNSFAVREALYTGTGTPESAGGTFTTSALYNLEVPAGVKAKQYANGAFQSIRFVESTI